MKLAVVGAAGHTGRFVVRNLLDRGLEPIVIGRSRTRLKAAGFGRLGLELREARLDDVAALDRAIAGAGIVVNCAGPFLDTARYVAPAAIRAGAHYLDVSAEQVSTSDIYAQFDSAARERGLIFLPSMAFFGGFADLLVSSIVESVTDYDAVTIAIALSYWHPTQGTRETGRKNTAPRMMVSGGALVPITTPPRDMTWTFPPPLQEQEVVQLPFSEVPVIFRHLPLAELRTFLTRNALSDVRNPETPAPAAVDASGRSAQQFTIHVAVTGRKGNRQLLARGKDIYHFTAPLIGEAVERIAIGDFRATGALPPASVFGATEFLTSLSAAEPSLTVEVLVD